MSSTNISQIAPMELLQTVIVVEKNNEAKMISG